MAMGKGRSRGPSSGAAYACSRPAAPGAAAPARLGLSCRQPGFSCPSWPTGLQLPKLAWQVERWKARRRRVGPSFGALRRMQLL